MEQPDPTQFMHLMVLVIAFYSIFILIGLAAVIIPMWFICKKAGLSPWLSFLNLVFPIGGLVLLYVLAFVDWKVVPVPQPYWQPYPQPPYPPAPPQPPQA